MAKLDITSHQRSALRAAAHPLRPVVMIGDRGLSESVLKEIDLNLNAHELIKIKVSGHDRPERDTLLASVCDKLACAAVHHLGHTLILYRPRLVEDDIFTTRAVRKPSEPHIPKKRAAEGVTRNARGRALKASRAESAPRRRTAADRPDAGAPIARDNAQHNIPRRGQGSSLTLRAGVRRNGPRRAK